MLFLQRVTGFKAEAVAGTMETLSATEAVTNVFDTAIKDETTLKERAGQGGLSPIPGIIGAISGTATFKTELDGQGAASPVVPLWASYLLAACGVKGTSSVWTPSSGLIEPVTIGYWQAGLYEAIYGAMGNLVVKGTAGEIVMCEWNFKGLYHAAAADVSPMPTPTYRTNIPPRLVNAIFTIGGAAYTLPSFELDLGNTVTLIQHAASGNATGYKYAYITKRRPMFKLPTAAVPLATKDWRAAWQAGTEMALVLQIGSSASGYNGLLITAPKLQLAEPPSAEDADGELRTQLSFQCNRNASTQDSELVFTFNGLSA